MNNGFFSLILKHWTDKPFSEDKIWKYNSESDSESAYFFMIVIVILGFQGQHQSNGAKVPATPFISS